jgi:hypothetical protein
MAPPIAGIIPSTSLHRWPQRAVIAAVLRPAVIAERFVTSLTHLAEEARRRSAGHEVSERPAGVGSPGTRRRRALTPGLSSLIESVLLSDKAAMATGAVVPVDGGADHRSPVAVPPLSWGTALVRAAVAGHCWQSDVP